MSFPLTYKLKIAIDEAVSDDTLNMLLNAHFHRNQDRTTKPVKYKSSFLNYRYPIEWETAPHNISVTIHFTPVINTILIFFLLTALLSTISFVSFLVTAFSLSIAFYFVTYLIITRQIKEEVYFALGITSSREEQFSEEQKEWLNDASRCPACGEHINDTHLFCPSCGLRLKQNRFTKPLEITPQKDTTTPKIRYHYTSKKDL